MTNTAGQAATMLLDRAAGRPRRWAKGSLGLTLSVLLGTGCSLDGLLNSDQLPKDVSDPAITQTPEGARSAYNGTLALFRTAFGDDNNASFVLTTGLLSDELLANADYNKALDQRTLPEGSSADGSVSNIYSNLQKVRGQASQAIGLLTRYLPDQPALAGHLYALQGYAEIFLAELFCSGVPLGTLDYDGDFTYRPGSTTREVLTHAVALFDTAIAIAADSARFVDLARVGRGRALLGLAEYPEAATAVAAVADDYRYDVRYNNVSTFPASARNFAVELAGRSRVYIVSEGEGFNGLAWRTSGDPRVNITVDSFFDGDNNYAYAYRPSKYDTTGATPIVLANGIEARLIEAEAALQAGDAATWLAKLNQLRQAAWPSISPAVAGPLPDTTDPGSPEARVDLLFRERAFWLFLTGHRQGDLRRLIRQYGRDQSEVYPVGTYPQGTGAPYGADVTLPIPTTEFVDPLYTGCLSRGA